MFFYNKLKEIFSKTKQYLYCRVEKFSHRVILLILRLFVIVNLLKSGGQAIDKFNNQESKRKEFK